MLKHYRIVIIQYIYGRLSFFRARKYRAYNIERLSNTNPTIISNDCLGGIILHTLKLRFNTPTVNLNMNKRDFIKLVNNLVTYSSCELVEKIDSDRPYPVGILKGVPGDIEIYFHHYDTFKIAKEKWIERSRRINYDNIYIILQGGNDVTYDMLLEFDKIPYKNKVVFTDKPYPEIKSAYCIPIYGDGYYDGKLTWYEGISGRRYFDRFDYVAFLNQSPK